METLAQNKLGNNHKDFHGRIKENVEVLEQIVNRSALHDEDLGSFCATCNKLIECINEFEVSPKLLDSDLDFYVKKLSSTYLFLKISIEQNEQTLFLAGRIATICYTLGKIRGFKTLVNYLYCEVSLIFPLIRLTQKSEILTPDEVLLLLLWLSNLTLVPFDLTSIDKMLEKKLFEIGLINIIKSSNASKSQTVSLILLSNLLTRSDTIERGLLDLYLKEHAIPKWADDRISYSQRLGHSQTINKILKKCPLKVSVRYWNLIYEKVLLMDISNLRLQVEEKQSGITNLNLLYMIKIFHKLAQISLTLTSRLKFQRISDIINHLLHDIVLTIIPNFDTNLRYATAKCLSYICVNLLLEATNYQEQLILYLCEQFEFEGLSLYPEKGTTCDIFQPHLTLDSQEISITKFHLLLLTIGFISLKKSLPFTLLPLIFSIVHKTLFLLQKRVNIFHGSQLRDSSCFILWAAFRLLVPDKIGFLDQGNPRMIDTVFFDLIRIIAFDNDLTVRRCGVAVLQEFVGRFGINFFSNKHRLATNSENGVGSFILSFMEVFKNVSLDPFQSSYSFMKQLRQLGFSGSLFIPDLLLRIENEDIEFEVKKLRIYELISLLNEEYTQQYKLTINPVTDFELPFSQEKLIERYKDNLLDSDWKLYLFSELSKTTAPNVDTALSVSNYLNNLFKYDPDVDFVHIAEGYINWINYCLFTFPSNNFKFRWDIIFSISESFPSAGMLQEYKDFFRNLSIEGNNILLENLKRFIYYIYKGNTIIAGSLFSYNHLKIDHITQIVSAMTNNENNNKGNFDINVKVKLIESLTENMRFFQFDHELINNLISLLDDYTLTNQGDVGSKIRLAALEMVSSNLDVFKNGFDLIELKLIRICGEINRKVCLKSLEVLSMIRGRYCLNFSENYYATVFQLYVEKIFDGDVQLNPAYLNDVSFSFWSGLVLSLGSLSAAKDELNESFDQLLIFLANSDDSLRKHVYQTLLDILRIPPGRLLKELHVHHTKRFISALNLFIRLYESNAPFPSNFNENLLFIRSYNLHINTTSLVRSRLVIKVFLQLSMYSESKEVKSKARKRLCWLACFSTSSNVRTYAIENILDLINEIMPNRIDLELQKRYTFLDEAQMKMRFKALENLVLELK